MDKKKKSEVREGLPGHLFRSPDSPSDGLSASPACHPRAPGLTAASLTLTSLSLRGSRCRCSRSTSSISYTLISKGSFREPARGGGKSTHCPGRLGLRPKAAASGSAAGISLLRCRPETEPGTPQVSSHITCTSVSTACTAVRVTALPHSLLASLVHREGPSHAGRNSWVAGTLGSAELRPKSLSLYCRVLRVNLRYGAGAGKGAPWDCVLINCRGLCTSTYNEARGKSIWLIITHARNWIFPTVGLKFIHCEGLYGPTAYKLPRAKHTWHS